METRGAADDGAGLSERARHAWLTGLASDTGWLPKHEPGLPGRVCSSGAPRAIQCNFSRIITVLFGLKPATGIPVG